MYNDVYEHTFLVVTLKGLRSANANFKVNNFFLKKCHLKLIISHLHQLFILARLVIIHIKALLDFKNHFHTQLF